MISRFFIDRPIFAWVLAIVVMVAGAISVVSLPIAQYPTIAPPQLAISAVYPGASAETVQSTVTQVIEQQMKGLDHLEYISSTSDNTGAASISLTFEQGTNPDIAQVQIQNKLQLATPLLPQPVQQQGLVVAKSAKNFLLALNLYSETGVHSSGDLGDMLASHFADPISRITGVGDTQLIGSQYAMRIWLDPYKLNSYKLVPDDVRAAVLAANAQVPAGQLGALPQPAGQQLNVTVTAQSRLRTADQFRNVLLKAGDGGAAVYLRDVARVEVGLDTYRFDGRYNGHPAAAMGIKLATGANALGTADAVKKQMALLVKQLPPDVKVSYPYDTTPFIRVSIGGVVETLFEAIALVFVVMFVFLQNWRATLIPTIAVPVVLLGVFGVLAVVGYSINTLTMFAMVLSIGLLVDDAIVVVENVERIMETEGLSAKEATRKSMSEISGALIAIVLVLVAVFLPMAFFGGSTGAIYRQFSVTIVAAMILSVLVALILTPALCATLLRPPKPKTTGAFGRFNRTFARGVERYESGLRGLIPRWGGFVLVYVAIIAALGVMFVRLPTGFLPDEDQGIMITLVQLPAGATLDRTKAVNRQIERYYQENEKDNVEGLFTAAGFSIVGSSQNAGLAFVQLRDWKHRKAGKNRIQAIAGRAFGAFSQIRDAQVFPIVPPSVPELGFVSGFDFELQDVGGIGHDGLVAAERQMLGMAAKDPSLAGVRPNQLPDVPELKVDIDPARAAALGVKLADANSVLSAAWGGTYVDDFLDRERVKRIYMQGDAPFRATPADLDRWYVRGASGEMSPFSAFATTAWRFGPFQLGRYNGSPAIEIQGQGAKGKSSGEAMATMETLAAKLPPGVGFEWTGLSYEERLGGARAPMLYALSILVVFLCLAALYESWTVPVAVLLVIPLGVIGAVLAVTLRGFANDIYFQVGLLTTMGLSAKNAILIVEFAEKAEREGKSPLESAVEGAKRRLRPILMTSLAFVAGVTPLALATGAGSGGQNDIGTSVVGGMITGTALAIFFVPLFFVLVRSGLRRLPKSPPPAEGAA